MLRAMAHVEGGVDQPRERGVRRFSAEVLDVGDDDQLAARPRDAHVDQVRRAALLRARRGEHAGPLGWSIDGVEHDHVTLLPLEAMHRAARDLFALGAEQAAHVLRLAIVGRYDGDVPSPGSLRLPGEGY